MAQAAGDVTSLVDRLRTSLLRVSGVCLVVLPLLLAAAYQHWHHDLYLLSELRRRQPLESMLQHLKGVSIEKLGNPFSADRLKAPQRLGYPSIGEVVEPVQEQLLLQDLHLALAEYCVEGKFSPPEFYPTYAIILSKQERDDVIVFSPKQNALQIAMPGGGSTYFLIPDRLSQHLERAIHPRA